MPTPINPNLAVDLGEVKNRADEREAAIQEIQESREQEAAMRRVESWDRNMTRAFKGIMPAPERRRMIERSLERENAED